MTQRRHQTAEVDCIWLAAGFCGLQPLMAAMAGEQSFPAGVVGRSQVLHHRWSTFRREPRLTVLARKFEANGQLAAHGDEARHLGHWRVAVELAKGLDRVVSVSSATRARNLQAREPIVRQMGGQERVCGIHDPKALQTGTQRGQGVRAGM